MLVTEQIEASCDRKNRSQTNTIVFIPPISGLVEPLVQNFRAVGHHMAAVGWDAITLEFGGQNGRQGEFSVSKSCFELTAFIDRQQKRQSGEIVVFGICSGAIAALYAASQLPKICGVFCWEVSLRYFYDRSHQRYYERRFGLRFCQKSALVEVQPIELVRGIQCHLAFGYSPSSPYCSSRNQLELGRMAKFGRVIPVAGVDHFLSDMGGVKNIDSILSDWCDYAVGTTFATS